MMIRSESGHIFYPLQIQEKKHGQKSARAQNPKHGAPGAVSTRMATQISRDSPVTKTVFRMVSCLLITNAIIFFIFAVFLCFQTNYAAGGGVGCSGGTLTTRHLPSIRTRYTR